MSVVDKFLIGMALFISHLIIFIIGSESGYSSAELSMQKKAIANGSATYETDSNGKTTFLWIIHPKMISP